MTKRDIAVIESAKDIRKYCCEHEQCAGCVLRTEDNSCILENSLAVSWEIPTVKTYKQDFLEKFPNANFESSSICRKMVYGEKHDCHGMTCQECWNESYIEKSEV